MQSFCVSVQFWSTVPMCEAFPLHAKQLSDISWVSAIQFNSENIYWEIALDATG